MMYDYKIMTDVQEKTFGIVAMKDNSIVNFIFIDTDDKNLVYNLVRLCNDLQLDPIHLEDVVCDAVA